MFFQAVVSPLLVTALCFSPNLATLAQESLNSKLLAATPRMLASGNQIFLNGRTLPGAWLQQQGTGGKISTHLSDGALRQLIGLDLLNSSNPAQQPVQWFSSATKPLTLNTRLLGGYRYLDITSLAQTAGWQIQANGNILAISTPATQVIDIRQGKQPTGDRLVVDLDRPTPWTLKPEAPTPKLTDSDAPPNRDWTITLDGVANPSLIQRYTPQPLPPTDLSKQVITPPSSPAEPLVKQVEIVKNQTLIRLSVPVGQFLQVSTISQPNRLIIDVRPDAMLERNITWATGLRWRQQFVNLGTDRFSVVWLEINPRTVGLKIKPMWANSQTLAGTAPLIQTAQRYLAVAGINGGYFNRNNKFPLGAIRQNNQWVSSPILNRGAIAWNDSGQFYFGRLTLNETLTTANNQTLPILFLNSGYVQSGIARYTSIWGPTYTPLTDNESLVIVQKNQVTNQLSGGKAGETAIPIPSDGYLLTLRGTSATAAAQLPIGTTLKITSTTTPADFSRYPYIIGAGPLLVQNRQIVLDAKNEKFSDAFIAEKAVRSGICTTATGNLMIAAVHNRVGGAGPSLAEHAKLMQSMGCVNALNLDGGSSTSLYLGGQLLDRSPSTAARVHNGIGIFLIPKQ
jgi:hypothetical protein